METQGSMTMLPSNSVMKLMAEKIDQEKMKLEKVELYHPPDRFGLAVRVICTRKDWEGFPLPCYIFAEELLDEHVDKKPFILADYEELIDKLVEKLNENSR